MDFGDVIFFLVFVGIIISNIMKAMKKAGKQKDENKEVGKQNVKKSGWKNVLEQMLAEARKQMEQAEGSGGSPSSGKPSGWEDLMSKKEPLPEKSIKRTSERKVARKLRQPILDDAPVRKRVKFRPECMRCNESMKEIADLGTGRQKGLIYCDSCGEQHKYQIVNGELKLKQADALRKKSVRVPERSYQEVEEKSRAHGKVPPVKYDETASPSETIKIPQQMTQADLMNAVVWSEILGKPIGLRDMEI